MKKRYITKETNEIQHIIALRNSRNKRYRYGEFLIEGTTAIEEAFKNKWPIKAIYYNNDIQLSNWAQRYIENKVTENIYAITQKLMEKVADRNDCPEIIAIGKAQIRHFSSYMPVIPETVAVLDEPKSPGNLGMIIRSALAFGVNAVVISGHGADEYDPKCIRSSVGCFFSMPFYRVEGIAKFIERINYLKKMFKVEIVATSDKGEISISDLISVKEMLLIIFGNEKKGVSKGYRDIANKVVRIPMPGAFTSLNIGVAASIFFYELAQKKEVHSKLRLQNRSKIDIVVEK